MKNWHEFVSRKMTYTASGITPSCHTHNVQLISDQFLEDGIDHVPEFGRAGAPSGVDRDQIPEQSPLVIGHVAGILIRSHPNSLWKHPLMGQSLRKSRPFFPVACDS